MIVLVMIFLDVTYLNTSFKYPNSAAPRYLPDTASTEVDGVDDGVVKIFIELWTDENDGVNNEFEDIDKSYSIPVTIKRYINISVFK